MSHADEVITDVNRRRVLARAHEDGFTIAWDYPGRTLLEVRILRSTERPAAAADEGADAGQDLVYQDVTGSFRDTGLDPRRAYHYAVFARHPGGDWVRWEEYSLPGAPRGGLSRFGRLFKHGMRGRVMPGLSVMLLTASLALFAAGALVSPPATASEGGQNGDEAPAVDEGLRAALDAARAYPGVGAVLDGRDVSVDSATPWGGTAEAPAGYTIQYRWGSAQAAEVGGEWPLLRSDAAPPRPPYENTPYRILATDVTGLQVDVLLDGPQVLQVKPVDGETRFVLEEQTWAPFSWFPWFTANPWVLAPVYVALAVLLMMRAWSRSRAWNRRLPSMTRHDRQFIARVAVLLFLVAGFVWQFYVGWYAASGPSLDGGGSTAGALATLPLLLIPPGLFVAGLVLELGAGAHRGSWALLALLSGAATAYFLAAAMTGATTNLNLTYYILLGVLTLIAIPRAFSAGKMGWSRNAAPRYG